MPDITNRPAAFIDAATIADRLTDVGAYGSRLEDDPGDVLADAHLESLYRRDEQWPQLVGLLIDRAELATDDAQHIRALREAATIYEAQLGDLESALVVSLTAFERDPASDGLRDALDSLAYRSGQWDEVLEAYMLAAGKVASESAELAGELWLRIACAHLVTTGDVGAVSEALERISELDCASVSSYLEMVERRVANLTMLDALIDLCGRIGDQARASRSLARGVAMADSTKQKARYQVAIAALAANRGNAPLSQWHYTEALRLDPQSRAAREALVAIYRERGDHRELARLLASARFTNSQTHNAVIALEAASIYAEELDEQTRAINLYAFAFSQDPEHLDAALPLAERYYNEKRWQELGPILELLIARSDELGPLQADPAELHLWRAQCSNAQSDFETARLSAVAALVHRPGSLEAARELALAESELGDPDAACDAFNRVLAIQREARAPASERAATLTEMARTRRVVGDDAAALTLYESGLDLAFTREGWSELREIHARAGNWRQLVATAKALCGRPEVSVADRVALLIAIGETRSAHLADAHGSISAYERAHKLDQNNRAVLHQLIEHYIAGEMWEQAVHSLRKVAALETDPLRRGKYLQSAATIARHHLDLDRVVELYNLALDCFFVSAPGIPEAIRPGCMKAFTSLARALYEACEFKTLERSYRQMIRRMRVGDAELPELWHGLGQVYRKHLRKAEEAIESFEVASALDQDRVTHQKILIDLYRNSYRNSPINSVDQIDTAAGRRMRLIEREPFVAGHYRELHHLYQRAGWHDEAWTALRALCFLDAASPDEERAYRRDRRPGTFAAGQLSVADWHSLRHPDEDSIITTILGLVAHTVTLDAALPARKLGLRNDPDPQFDPLRRMFSSVTDALGVGGHALCVQPDTPGDVLLANVRRGRKLAPAFAVGRALYDGQSVDAMIYALGRAVSYGRREVLLRLVLPAAADLEAVFLAASSLSRSDVPVSPALAPMVARYQSLLGHRLRPEWRRALASAVEAFVANGEPFCLEAWGYAVDAAARRAGLLLSSDLVAAASQLGREPRFTAGQRTEDKIADLIVHSVSPTHHRLRRKMGWTSLKTTSQRCGALKDANAELRALKPSPLKAKRR